MAISGNRGRTASTHGRWLHTAGRAVLYIAMYAVYLAMIVIGLAFLVTLVFHVIPPLVTGSLPTRRSILIGLGAPVLMVLLSLLAYAPDLTRRALGRKDWHVATSARGAAGGYFSLLALVTGGTIASLIVTIPLMLLISFVRGML